MHWFLVPFSSLSSLPLESPFILLVAYSKQGRTQEFALGYRPLLFPPLPILSHSLPFPLSFSFPLEANGLGSAVSSPSENLVHSKAARKPLEANHFDK